MFRFSRKPASKPRSLTDVVSASIKRDKENAEPKAKKTGAQKAVAPVVIPPAVESKTGGQKAKIAELEKQIASAKAARDTKANAAAAARREAFIRQAVRKTTPAQAQAAASLFDAYSGNSASLQTLEDFFSKMPDHPSLTKVKKADIPRAVQSHLGS